MSIKVGINGFGRIGRLVFRAGIENPEIRVCRDQRSFYDSLIIWHICCNMIQFMENLAAKSHLTILLLR